MEIVFDIGDIQEEVLTLGIEGISIKWYCNDKEINEEINEELK